MQAAATLTSCGDGPRALLEGSFGLVEYRLKCVAPRIWRMEQAGLPQASAILRFGENAEGFTLDATRLRNVLFQRAE